MTTPEERRKIIQQQIKPSRYDHLRKMQIARLEAKIAQWQSILDHLRAQDEQPKAAQ